jgi:hypothetical protein
MALDAAPAAVSPLERPVCQEHTARVAIGTCTRCGRFVCESCVSERRLCPACVQHQFLGVPSSEPRALWAIRLLTAHAVVDGLSVLLSLLGLASGPSDFLSLAETIVGVATFGVILGAAIAFLRWLHLAVRQALALQIEVGVTAGWAVGYWFIPFANLVRPYRAIRNLLTGLGGEELASSARVSLWWGVWIIGNMLSRLETKLTMQQGLEALPSIPLNVLRILTSLLSLAGALLCIGIVRAIQQELSAKRP